MKLFQTLLPTLQKTNKTKSVLTLFFGLMFIIGASAGVHTLHAASKTATKALSASSIDTKITTKITATPTTQKIVAPITPTKEIPVVETSIEKPVIKETIEPINTNAEIPVPELEAPMKPTLDILEELVISLPENVKPAVSPIKPATPTIKPVDTTQNVVIPTNNIIPNTLVPAHEDLAPAEPNDDNPGFQTDPTLVTDSDFCPSGQRIKVSPSNATMITTAGWGDSEDLVDEQERAEIGHNPWTIFGHNSPETETVEITWPSAVQVTALYVFGFADTDGNLDIMASNDGQNAIQTSVDLLNDDWAKANFAEIIDTIRFTRDAEKDNATEVVLCTVRNGNNGEPGTGTDTGNGNGQTGSTDPVEPEAVDPTQCGAYGAGNRTRTISQMIGTNSFVNNFNDDIAPGILREYRYLEKNLLDDGNVGINGQDGASYTAANYEKFTYPAARGANQVYPESPNQPIEYMPVVFGDVYQAENLPSDYELPEHYAQYEELIENAHQTYTEIPTAYNHHAEFMYQFVDKLKNHGPIAMNESGSWTVPVAEFNYIENNNESDKWWNGGHKGDHRGRFTPQEYAAMTSADYDGHCGTMGAETGIKAADQDLHLVMSGMARLYNEIQSEASDPLNRWKSPDQTGARWLEEFIEWSEEHRGPGNLPVDAINFHIYPVHTDTDHSDGIDNIGVSPEAYHLEEHINYFDTVRDNYNAQHGRNLELWFSEFGYTTTPKPADQSFWMAYATHENSYKWIPRIFTAAFAQDIDMLNHFWAKDQDGGIWSLQAGLRESDSDKKPTYYAVKAYTEALGDMRFVGKVQYCNDNGINVYAFKEPNSNRGAYVIWTGNEEELEYTLPLNVSSAEEIRIQYATDLNDIPHINHTNLNGSLDLNVNGYSTVVLVDQLNPALSYVNGDVIQSGSICEGNNFTGGGTSNLQPANTENQAVATKKTTVKKLTPLTITEKKEKLMEWLKSLSVEKQKAALKKIFNRLKNKSQ